MKNYSPRAGSLAEKVITHLAAHSDPLRTADIVQLFGAASGSVRNMLSAAVSHGQLRLVEVEGKPAYAAGEGASDTAAPSTKKRKGSARKRSPVRGGAEPTAEEETPAAATGPLSIATHSDGDITFLGAPVGEDGSVQLSPEHAKQLAQHIVRQSALALFA